MTTENVIQNILSASNPIQFFGVLGYWKDLLGERLILMEDYNEVAEIIAATVGLIHGIDLDKITSSFNKTTAKNVKNALIHVNTSINKTNAGVVTL